MRPGPRDTWRCCKCSILNFVAYGSGECPDCSHRRCGGCGGFGRDRYRGSIGSKSTEITEKNAKEKDEGKFKQEALASASNQKSSQEKQLSSPPSQWRDSIDPRLPEEEPEEIPVAPLGRGVRKKSNRHKRKGRKISSSPLDKTVQTTGNDSSGSFSATVEENQGIPNLPRNDIIQTVDNHSVEPFSEKDQGIEKTIRPPMPIRTEFINPSIPTTGAANSALSEPLDTKASQETLLWTQLSLCWRDRYNDNIPKEIKFLTFRQVELLSEEPLLQTSDHLKHYLEQYTGTDWIWWPLKPPRKKLPDTCKRLKWSCTCGSQRFVDIPEDLAQKILSYLSVAEKSTIRRHGNDPSSKPEGHSVSPSVSSSAPMLCGCGGQNQTFQARQGGTGRTSTGFTDSSSLGNSTKTEVPPNFYILFCTYRGENLKRREIKVDTTMDDNILVRTISRMHREMIGELRFWLHPTVLAFCEFVKYTRDGPDHLSKHREPELPLDKDYHYDSRPLKGEPYEPPISAHEWYDHFYKVQYVNGCRCALRRIPKRDREFFYNNTYKGREPMWGLFAERRISFLRVLLWSSAILVGGLIFFIWWLSNHPGDLQNAIVPIATVSALMGWFWLSLSDHFNRKF
jgi:hypothetical protein